MKQVNCYKNMPQDEEEEAIYQSGLMKWKNGSAGPSWAVLVEAMAYAKIGIHSICKQ